MNFSNEILNSEERSRLRLVSSETPCENLISRLNKNSFDHGRYALRVLGNYFVGEKKR